VPEMLARTDHDFVLEERRPRRAAKRVRRLAVLRSLFRNPGRTIVGASAAAVGVAIIVNALALQGGPHPAPFFRTPHEAREPATPLPPARPAALTQPTAPTEPDRAVAPAQQAAPAQQTAPAGVPAAVPMPPRVQRNAAVPATAPAQSAPAGTVQAPPVPPANIPNVARDAIGDVLRGGAQAGGTTEAVRQEPIRQVLAAQRALNKLNYGPIKPDGLFGPGTRQALERFERDRKLPVTGEAAGRTARELAAASGIPVD
jgi:hypothetical protein